MIELLRALRLLYPSPLLYGDATLGIATDAEISRRARDVGLPDDGSIFFRLPQHDDSQQPKESLVGPSSGAPAAGGATGGGPAFTPYNAFNMGSSFVPGKPNTASGVNISRRGVNDLAQGRPRQPDEEPIAWPTISADAQREAQPYVMVGSFPLRFLNMNADYTQEGRSAHVSREDYFEGLLWYWDTVQNRYPFAVHPTFKYWALMDVYRRAEWLRRCGMWEYGHASLKRCVPFLTCILYCCNPLIEISASVIPIPR